MINFTSEEIVKRSGHWSLNEDVKLLNKLRSLDELLSTKSKEILDNVNKTEDKVSAESILVKNLINDFYLVGHKQFIENRVEEENDSKLFNEQSKSALENEESFKLKSVDQDTLIHEQMKSVLDSSLLFIREKLKDLNEDEQSTDPDTDQKLESLIKNHRYNQKRLPPIINSERFKTEIFDLVKQQSNTSKANLNRSKSQTESSLDTKSTTTETSSIISDLETNLINERILEINENKFVEKLNANLNTHSNATKQLPSISSTNDEQNRKEITGNLVKEKQILDRNSTLKSPNFLDESQTNRDTLRNDLDAIFGKAENLKNSKSSKNKIFDDEDSDDELFLPASAAQTQKLADSTKDKLFKIDKFSSNESIDEAKKVDKTVSKDLFDSNVKSSDVKKKAIDKLFESDSDDDNIFSTRLPAKKSLIDKDDKPAIKIESKLEDKSLIKSEDKLANEVSKVDLDTSNKESIKEISSKESLPKQDKTEEKMPNKKELFKNQLEDLFSKKRNLNQGFIKLNKNEEANEDVNDLVFDKDQDNTETKTEATKLSVSSNSEILSPVNKQRKEFDLFSSKPSDDPFLAEDLNFKASTLDNNLIKSRVKFVNRKRPSKPAKANKDLNKVQIDAPASNVQKNLEIIDEVKVDQNISKQTAKEAVDTVKSPIKPKTVTETEPLKLTKEPEPLKLAKEPEPLKLTKEPSKSLIVTKTEKKTLFTDSEEDDLDKEFKLDKKVNDKRNLNEALDRKFKKLFDDSDEEDLLFKSSSKAPLKSTSKEKEPITETKDVDHVKKKALTLFDDSDSDDNLFKS